MAWGRRELAYRAAGWGNPNTSTLAHVVLMGQVQGGAHLCGYSVTQLVTFQQMTLQMRPTVNWHPRLRQGGLTHSTIIP